MVAVIKQESWVDKWVEFQVKSAGIPQWDGGCLERFGADFARGEDVLQKPQLSTWTSSTYSMICDLGNEAPKDHEMGYWLGERHEAALVRRPGEASSCLAQATCAGQQQEENGEGEWGAIEPTECRVGGIGAQEGDWGFCGMMVVCLLEAFFLSSSGGAEVEVEVWRW